jgi:hypothetical protein
MLALVGSATSACVAPARTYPTYESKAADTAASAVAAVETARLVARATVAGRATANFAVVTLTDAEGDAAAIQGTFASILPPDHRADLLRAELDALLTQAVDAVSALRIAARRHEFARFPQVIPDLEDASKRLSAFEQAHGA